MTTAETLAAQASTRHYGLAVLELGEEGGTLVIPGHHPDRRTLAALAHWARTVWRNPLNDPWGIDAPGPDEIQRVRGIIVHACARGWAAEERIPAAELETVDPASNTCEGCREVGATWALLYAPDAQDHPAAFPVTVWEYDV